MFYGGKDWADERDSLEMVIRAPGQSKVVGLPTGSCLLLTNQWH